MKSIVEEIKEVYKKHIKEINKSKFNIFNALHKIDDEVNLHSRFISYLISDKSGHQLGNFFFKSFLENVLEMTDFTTDNYLVLPNETIKSEYKNIDILIVNKNDNKAIIIENKTRNSTPDSNRRVLKNDGYDGQLERYYNTIKKGIDANGKKINQEYISEKISVYYLSLNNKKTPNLESIGELKELGIEVKLIHYDNQIIKWLEKCIRKIENQEIKSIIEQYLEIVKKITNNDISYKRIKELQETFSYDIQTTNSVKYLLDNMKNIETNCVIEFWISLKKEIKKIPNIFNVNLFYEETHIENEDEFKTLIKSQTKKTNQGILFEFKNKKLYLSAYDNNISYGIIETNFFKYFSVDYVKEIDLYDFTNDLTFKLLNISHFNKVIDEIIQEITNQSNNNFNNLEKITTHNKELRIKTTK